MPRRDKGFTLIELLVVIAIIGIIGMIAAPKLITALDKGKVTATKGGMDNIDKALKMYYMNNDQYPQVGDPGALVPAPGALEQFLSPNYLETPNLTDAWGKPLYYGSDGTHYTLRSYGKNGVMDPAVGTAALGELDFNADILIVDGSKAQWPR